MIRSIETQGHRPQENLLLDVADPLVAMSHMMSLKKGKEVLLDLDQPAFMRRILGLGLPRCEMSSQRAAIPAPISKLLNIVLGQDGIFFPIEES
jgi:hypothetical protein